MPVHEISGPTKSAKSPSSAGAARATRKTHDGDDSCNRRGARSHRRNTNGGQQSGHEEDFRRLPGKRPDDPADMDVAERHRLSIDRWFYPCELKMHRGLADSVCWTMAAPSLQSTCRVTGGADGLAHEVHRSGSGRVRPR
ncbi:MAG TPA: TipAS antibiotic-recognition domain-containing protein [Gammaproteobacteria bacterium]